jgi:hypothetical protein
MKKVINGISDKSLAHESGRADEKYDATESVLRENVVSQNEYSVIVRHQPSKHYYRHFNMDIMKKKDRDFCSGCKLIILFFGFLLG